VLKGSIARLERALQSLFIDTHVDKHGYTEAAVPYIVGGDALQGTGQLPKFEEDLFELKARSHEIARDRTRSHEIARLAASTQIEREAGGRVGAGVGGGQVVGG